MDSEWYQYFFATEFVDMFPQTNGDILLQSTLVWNGSRKLTSIRCIVHVETVCLLSNTQRMKKESCITLDVAMEDYYRIRNEGKNSNSDK